MAVSSCEQPAYACAVCEADLDGRDLGDGMVCLTCPEHGDLVLAPPAPSPGPWPHAWERWGERTGPVGAGFRTRACGRCGTTENRPA